MERELELVCFQCGKTETYRGNYPEYWALEDGWEHNSTKTEWLCPSCSLLRAGLDD